MRDLATYLNVSELSLLTRVLGTMLNAYMVML